MKRAPQDKAVWEMSAATALITVAIAVSCGGDYDRGYELGKSEGMADGYREGLIAGRAEATERGIQRATEAATSGVAIRLYIGPLATAAASATIFGILLQYALLFRFAHTHQLSRIGAPFVPGLTKARCFRVLGEIRNVALEHMRQIDEVRRRSEIGSAKLKAAQTIATHRLQASSGLEQAFLRKIVVEAEREFDRIVESAKNRYERG
jgi:hypothetical protein